MSPVIAALNSRTRIKILRLLAREPKNVKEIFSELSKQEGFRVKYPESIYKALQKLVDCGLVKKYYDRERGLLYSPVCSKIEIDLSKL